jgi:hypothetical protein
LLSLAGKLPVSAPDHLTRRIPNPIAACPLHVEVRRQFLLTVSNTLSILAIFATKEGGLLARALSGDIPGLHKAQMPGAQERRITDRLEVKGKGQKAL